MDTKIGLHFISGFVNRLSQTAWSEFFFGILTVSEEFPFNFPIFFQRQFVLFISSLVPNFLFKKFSA